MIYEIICNGKVHYTRPEGHPDIAEALALIEWHKKICGVSSYEVRPTKRAADSPKASAHSAKSRVRKSKVIRPAISG